MDSTIVSALSAVLGSVVGGASTIITTLVNQNTESRRERMRAEIQQREKLYSEFIDACCRLSIQSYQFSLQEVECLLPVYALINQMRLFSSDAVSAAAEKTIQDILDQYFTGNLTPEQLYKLAKSGQADLVRSFSEACREELKALRIRA